ncbi:MAG: ABC transporter ATP-binding protein [Planctomycetota bacterium]
MPTIEIEGLTKQFPRRRPLRDWVRRPFTSPTVTALDGVDLKLVDGGIVGLIGPNGAGKTTLLKALAGLVLATEGRIRVDGDDVTNHPRQLRGRVSMVVADERSFYWRLSVIENLRFFAALQGLRRAEAEARVSECLAAVDLTDRARQTFHSLSTGMRQRLAIVRGLLSEPEILLLDEATRSLDPSAAANIHQLVRALHARDPRRLIFYSTHNLEEAEHLCSRVVALKAGRIVAEYDLDRARARIAQQFLIRTVPLLELDVLASVVGIAVVPNSNDGSHPIGVTVRCESLAALNRLIDELRAREYSICEVTPQRSTLRELYFNESAAES